ncbi:MAG: hypothetical protein WCF98_07880 [Synechococcus sp. ELA057]
MAAFDPRATLLARNAGLWDGHFLQLDGAADGEAVERDRFPSRLLVEERQGLINADLTNLTSGVVRSMRFADPPPEMQIHPDGHWSLGPDRIGAWPWVSELCLTLGDRRRRAVVRLEGERLISAVLVLEARPGVEVPLPPPLRLPRLQEAGCWLWRSDDLELRAAAGWVELQWQHQPDDSVRLRRAYSPYGVLDPLEGMAGP